MNRKSRGSTLAVIILLMLLLGACGGTGTTSSQPSSTPSPAPATSGGNEQPVPTSTNAQSSDIPDTQVFVTYMPPSGVYHLEFPEGWARTAQGDDVSFVSNLNAMQVTLSAASTAPTANSVQKNEASILQGTGRAMRDIQVKDVQLPHGAAILMTYTANSDPNAVTGKQVRLELNRYYFFHLGKVAVLMLSAPLGADNVDQWTHIAQSFQWG
jgi:hypothetical protein